MIGVCQTEPAQTTLMSLIHFSINHTDPALEILVIVQKILQVPITELVQSILDFMH
jgi:hypothetical protein